VKRYKPNLRKRERNERKGKENPNQSPRQGVWIKEEEGEEEEMYRELYRP
jgi:hypothetical protein